MNGGEQESRKGPQLRDRTFVRPNETESSLHPTLEFERERMGYGGEGDVHRATLTYSDIQKIGGFVFKKTDETDAASMHETLAQWQDIKDIKSHLTQAGRAGFNIPGTVRGVITKDRVTGLLITDLSEGGKNELIDLKKLRIGDNPFKISRAQMEAIKAAVIQDMDIAKENNLKLVSGSSCLDPWMIVVNKKTGECRVYIVDIGKYTSKTRDPFLRVDRTNDPEELYERGRTAIDVLERDIYRAQSQ